MFRSGRYSGLLRPISYGIDIFIIHFFAFKAFGGSIPYFNFVVFISIAWIVLSLRSGFYEIYRFTHVANIMSLLGKQGIIFGLIIFAFFGFYNQFDAPSSTILKYILFVMASIGILKFGIYYLLKKYRLHLGGNIRKVVILGLNQKTDQLRKFFTSNPVYGYKLYKTFDLKENGALEESMDYVLDEDIDEIYASVGELSNKDLVKLIEFVDNNLKILKFLPDNKEIYSKKLDFSYYVVLPILSMRKIPMDKPFNKFIKRSFDIVLSLVIIVGVLSWLTPLLGLFIKLESKGPVFFKQKRNG